MDWWHCRSEARAPPPWECSHHSISCCLRSPSAETAPSAAHLSLPFARYPPPLAPPTGPPHLTLHLCHLGVLRLSAAGAGARRPGSRHGLLKVALPHLQHQGSGGWVQGAASRCARHQPGRPVHLYSCTAPRASPYTHTSLPSLQPLLCPPPPRPPPHLHQGHVFSEQAAAEGDGNGRLHLRAAGVGGSRFTSSCQLFKP